MNIIIESLANECKINIFNYNSKYSLNAAIQTDIELNQKIYIELNQKIYILKTFPYIGRLIPEMSNSRFREIIYKKSRHSGYRIMYFVSDYDNSIHVFNIINSKQNFNKILKLHNYFNNYFNF